MMSRKWMVGGIVALTTVVVGIMAFFAVCGAVGGLDSGASGCVTHVRAAVTIMHARILVTAFFFAAGIFALLYAEKKREVDDSPWLFVAHSFLLLVAFGVLREVGLFSRLAVNMDEAAYFESFLLAEALGRLRIWDWFVVLLVCVPPFLAFRNFSWKQPSLRPSFWIVAASVFALGLYYTTYHYNYYYDQWHGADRVLVAVLALASLAHPTFVTPFVLVVSLIIGQFDHPLVNGYTMTDKQALFDVLLLWSAYLTMRLVDRRIGARPFIVVGYCLVAAHYFYSGLGKLVIGWVQENDFSYIFVAAYNNGWLGFLGENWMLHIQGTASALNGPGMVFTLVSEVGVLVGLWHRRLAAAFLAGTILLHLMIFAASGILFWTWILLDTGLIIALLRFDTRLPAPPPVRHLPFLMSLFIIPATFVLSDPKVLAWFDSPLYTHYRFYAIGASGKAYEVPPASFAPYDTPFAQGRFLYLDSLPSLSFTYGAVVDREQYRALKNIKTPEEIVAYEGDVLSTARNPDSGKEAFEEFMRRWFTHVNRHGPEYVPPSLMFPPQHIWTGPVGGSAFKWNEPIVRVETKRHDIFFDGRRRHTLRDTVVIRTEIVQ